MALYITTETREYVWYVGENYPAIYCDQLEIQADGNELEFIRNNFKNIPMSSKKVVTWVGVAARFILRNLR